MSLGSDRPPAAPYRGEDRRQAMPQHVVGLPLVPSLLGLLVLLASTFVLARDDGNATAAAAGLRVLSAALLCSAGVLCLARWRMTGLTRPALIGAGLVVLGVLRPLLQELSVLVDTGSRPLSWQVTSTATAAAAIWLILWARRAPTIDAGARPAWVLAGVALTVPLGCVLLLASAEALRLQADAVPAAVPGVLAGAFWWLLAALEQRARLDGRSPWLVPVLALLGCGAFLRALAGASGGSAEALSAAFVVAAGVVAMHGAFADVLITASAQSSRVLRLTADVRDHQERERTAQRLERERVHEVRNVLAGLHGATATLRKYEDRLDPGVRRRLEDAVSSELKRLSHLVDPSAVEPLADVDLTQALVHVIEAEREQGADLRVDLPPVTRVRARAHDLATIASVLLVNARRHAPGSPVVLRAVEGDGEVRVYVEDRGPGVPLDKRVSVFERGERAGAKAPGQGLGLYVARRLAGEMGGTLTVESRHGGGASFVLTLNAASGQAPAQRPDCVVEAGEPADSR